MPAVLFIIGFVLPHNETNAAFQFPSGDAFLKFSSVLLYNHREDATYNLIG